MANEDNPSAHEPLLSSQNSNNPSKIKNCVQWILKILMLAVLAGWILIILLVCFMNIFYLWMLEVEDEPIFSLAGGTILVFTTPILIITCLAVAYFLIRGDNEASMDEKTLTKKPPRLRLWTFPVLVDGPFGVVSAAEFIVICSVFVYVIWALIGYTLKNLPVVDDYPPEKRRVVMLECTGKSFAAIGSYFLGFLFIPVTRGSVLLRLIDIPFEHAAKYHIWLGNLMMLMFTLHGLLYTIGYALDGELLQALTSWSDSDVANFPGVINYFVMLLIWVTSTFPVRKKQFELFFYTHQLYIVFLILLAMHADGESFSVLAGGVFLFSLDRLLRFCQSQKTVDVISAKCFPCGIVELVLAKPADLKYNALSFIFLKIKEVSWLQWHPFSVSSSPLDGKNHVSVLVKNSGNWTEKLNRYISNGSQNGAQIGSPMQVLPQITASVEGPYGHDHPYHLTYGNLILVAGGIGISPFFAILNDIFHRKREGKFCLPKNITLIWAVKKHDELSLLSTLNLKSISSSFPGKLNLEIHIYVTREAEPPLEEGKVHQGAKSLIFPVSGRNCISGLVATGNLNWSSVFVVFSILGFGVLLVLVQLFMIEPLGIGAFWVKGLVFIACTIASPILFGGPVICLWHFWGKRKLKSEEEETDKNIDVLQQNMAAPQGHDSILKTSGAHTVVSYGSRPDFKGIFGAISECCGHVDVGVIVCGPPSLQASVARECRSRTIDREPHHPIFHFNSHSFDL